MALRSRVVLVGRNVEVVVTGFDRFPDGQFDYGTDRSMRGRAQSVRARETYESETAGIMDAITLHHETTVIDWTLTLEEVQHIFNPLDSLPLPSIVVVGPDGGALTLPGANVLEDAIAGFSHARVLVKNPARWRLYFGRIASESPEGDRGIQRNTLEMDSIDLGVSGSGNPIPNPMFLAPGATIPV